jgi:hypothetical protein
MGQYFQAVNLDKREFVCPWCVGEVAKLWEWAANPHGALFTLLLRKSTEGGGGDFHGVTYEQNPQAIVGRWAGDRVVLCGDYDDSHLWDALARSSGRSPLQCGDPRKVLHVAMVDLAGRVIGCRGFRTHQRVRAPAVFRSMGAIAAVTVNDVVQVAAALLGKRKAGFPPVRIGQKLA